MTLIAPGRLRPESASFYAPHHTSRSYSSFRAHFILSRVLSFHPRKWRNKSLPPVFSSSSCIDRKEHAQTHSRVVETLSAMRKRNLDERAVKMNRARDRIEAENRARVEKALSAMRLGHRHGDGGAADVAGRLERAPAHLRPILAIFMSPAFKQAFLAYAQQVACGEVVMPSASALDRQYRTANTAAASPPPSSGKSVPARNAAAAAAAGVPGGTSAVRGGNPPPRRAISLDCPETVAEAAAKASAPVPPARGAERRRQVAFGDVPPTKSEANLIAAGKHRSLKAKAPGARQAGIGGGGGERFSASGRRRSAAGASRREGGEHQASGVSNAAKWRKHREGSDFNMTLTADTATGRTGMNPARDGRGGGATATAAPARGRGSRGTVPPIARKIGLETLPFAGDDVPYFSVRTAHVQIPSKT